MKDSNCVPNAQSFPIQKLATNYPVLSTTSLLCSESVETVNFPLIVCELFCNCIVCRGWEE